MSGEQIDALIAWARGEIGQRESGGQNCGPRIQHYQSATFNGPGDSWCMSFQICGLIDTLGHSPLPRSGSCETVRKWALKQGLITDEPAKGRIGLLINPETNRAHHAWLVVDDPTDGGVPTVEGNTNDDGSVNGNGVYARIRGASSEPVAEYIDLWRVEA